MNIKSINLEILIKQYRLQSKVEKGYELITDLLENSDMSTIEIILRSHIIDPIINAAEIEAREQCRFINRVLQLITNSSICKLHRLPTTRKIN